jgi:hypothetical protein
VYNGFYRAKFDYGAIWLSLKNQSSIRIEEFFRSGEIISLRLFYNWYGSGAAHPNRRYSSINLAGPTMGRFELGDLFDRNSEAIQFLMKYCEIDIRRQLLAFDDKIELLSYPKTEEEAWRTLSQFNFYKSGITINFSRMMFWLTFMDRRKSGCLGK